MTWRPVNRPASDGAVNPFAVQAPSDPARYAEVNATLLRDRAYGSVRLTGPALAYWMVHTPAGDLKAWVMAENERRIVASGWHYTSIGYVKSGQIDVGHGHYGGLRIVGRSGTGAGEVDHAAVAALAGPDGSVVRLFVRDDQEADSE